jgi:hypothetical protein
MGKSLAQQSIELSIIEESEERARNGGSHTLAHHALDEDARELKRKREERRNG